MLMVIRNGIAASNVKLIFELSLMIILMELGGSGKRKSDHSAITICTHAARGLETRETDQ